MIVSSKCTVLYFDAKAFDKATEGFSTDKELEGLVWCTKGTYIKALLPLSAYQRYDDNV